MVYAIGEGASIVRRMKALGISFKGVYITVSPTRPDWSDLMGSDGDFVVTPAQWSQDIQTSCEVFGSMQEYTSQYEAAYGIPTDYAATMMTTAGIMLQLAMQENNSTSIEAIRMGLASMSHDTIYGRVRFSLAQRNFGRAPVGMQVQVRSQTNLMRCAHIGLDEALL